MNNEYADTTSEYAAPALEVLGTMADLTQSGPNTECACNGSY